MAPTVADIVVDGFVRAGIARLFVAGPTLAGIDAAARRCGLPVVDAGSAATASLLAAVTGEIGDEPGVALIAGVTPAGVKPAVGHAISSRAPMLVMSPGPQPPAALSMVKGRVTLTSESAAHGVAHAIQLTLAPPRGPVHLALDVETAERPAVPVATIVRPAPVPPPDPRALDAAARRLGAATRPLLVVGLECRGGDVAKWLRPLAETLPAPVLVTPRARGVLPDPHPLNLGTVGEGGALLTRADLVVAVGVDALEALPLARAPVAPVLHLGGTPSARADWVPSAEVVGDLALVIEELAPRLRGLSRADWDVAELDRLRRQIAAARQTGRGPERVVAIARDAAPAGTIAAADRGLCEAAVTAAWQAVGPSEILVPGQTGLPAFAVTAALAAQLARPDGRALAFTDTAGLADDHGALGVVARLGAPVVVIALGPPDASVSPARATDLGIASVAAPTEAALARALGGALVGRAPCLVDTRGGQGWSPSV